MNIELDPEIEAVFKVSSAVSGKFVYAATLYSNLFFFIVSHGTSVYLMKKSSKRRRTKEQVKED